MTQADLTQPIVLDGAYMVFRIETLEDVEAAERQLAALKANILADRKGIDCMGRCLYCNEPGHAIEECDSTHAMPAGG